MGLAKGDLRLRWKGKHVSVVGLGKSNMALIRYLARRGVSITARDQKSADELGAAVDELRRLGAEMRLGPGYLKDLAASDGIFLTPGMRKDLPQIEEARVLGVEITSETNLFMELCRAPVVGITGSSGKTTTTTLVGALLEAAGHKVYVGGNIGRPLIEVVDEIKESAVVVLELSSFQLELATRSPQVACITNITPNHLDVHPDMEAYVAAKKRIYQFQSDSDVLVLNAVNEHTRAMAKGARGRVVWFSAAGEVPLGAFVDSGRIVIAKDGRSGGTLTDVCGLDEIRLLGDHNVENVLAACAIADQLGVTPGTMRDVVSTFTGVAHRLELVREANGVAYYNDSIATSPSRAVAGIKAFDRPIHLIAGGYDKHLPWDEFAEVVAERVKTLVLIGQAGPAIERAVLDAKGATKPRIVYADSLKEAVAVAAGAAVPGDVVLLSPACASYDMFPNFEVRGEQFRKWVREYTESAECESASGRDATKVGITFDDAH